MDEEMNKSPLSSPDKQLDESGITMLDVLQEEEDLENDAEAVLGAGDDSSCTYSLGYMKRQPLYACITCCPALGEKVGGICLACSYHCHEGHELLELYTKRYFKCDCGTSKFPEANQCKLINDKTVNADNTYNQNFRGKYCTCGRPYPDPDDDTEDNMIQCIICEDWFHGRHLKVKDAPPPDDDFSEMICHLCVSRLPFLKFYLDFAVNGTSKSDTSKEIDVTSSPKDSKGDVPDALLKQEESKAVDGEAKQDAKTIVNCSTDITKGDCKLKSINEADPPEGSLFLIDNWRKELCTCSSCKEMYKENKVSFLTDFEDTVSYYESEGRAKRQAARGVQREIDALSSLDRITRTEVVHEYNNLSISLREYLKKFAENGKVVRGEDIKEFFSQLSANKKQKNGGMQYFCK